MFKSNNAPPWLYTHIAELSVFLIIPYAAELPCMHQSNLPNTLRHHSNLNGVHTNRVKIKFFTGWTF